MTKAANVVASGQSWAAQLIEMYTDGFSDAEVAAGLKITIAEYYNQIAENQAFAKLVEFGRTLSLAFWERQARQNLQNKQFNTPLYNFYMKNKHGWADKIDTTAQTDVTTYDLDDLRGKMAKEISKFIAKHSPELTDAQRVLSGVGKDLMQEATDGVSIQSE